MRRSGLWHPRLAQLVVGLGHGDELIVGTSDRASFQVEAEPQLGEEQQLVAHHRRAPAVGRRRGLDGVEQPFERLVNLRIGLAFRKHARG